MFNQLDLSMQLLWREPWLKPLIDYDLGSENCGFCKGKFNGLSFVTSCEFCEIGIMHDKCANSHILKRHRSELDTKIGRHKDKPLHDFQ
jgi:hypothetical protein